MLSTRHDLHRLKRAENRHQILACANPLEFMSFTFTMSKCEYVCVEEKEKETGEGERETQTETKKKKIKCTAFRILYWLNRP